MSKILILYKSKYGSTEKYANWIAEELGGDCFNIKEFKIQNFSNYDCIIFGGYLHAVGISGLEFVKNNFEIVKNKKIIIFSVGCSPIKNETIQNIYQHNFSEEKYFLKMFKESKNWLNKSLIEPIIKELK